MKNWKNQIETLKLATEQERNRESDFFYYVHYYAG